MSRRSGIPVLYADDFVASDPADGIHLSAESHGKLGKAVAQWILDRIN
jgi:lysophospholipase L1-like esterase